MTESAMNIRIEKVNIEDAPELLSIYAPYVRDTAVSFECEVPSLTEFEERIRSISSVFPYIKAVSDGRIVGYAYATKFRMRKAYDRSVEVTVYVRSDYKQNGIGRLLYTELERILADIGILNMNAWIASAENEDERLTDSSRIFHKKMGFSVVGTFHNSGYKFGKWYDMTCMEKLIGEHKAEPEPVEFGCWEKFI